MDYVGYGLHLHGIAREWMCGLHHQQQVRAGTSCQPVSFLQMRDLHMSKIWIPILRQLHFSTAMTAGSLCPFRATGCNPVLAKHCPAIIVKLARGSLTGHFKLTGVDRKLSPSGDSAT